MEDYRSTSYKKYASQRFAKSSSKDKEVRFKEGVVQEGYGQQAISGRGAEGRIEFVGTTTDGKEVTPVAETTAPPDVSPVAQDVFRDKSITSVPVSPGVASKLSQQSLKEDALYYVDVKKKKVEKEIPEWKTSFKESPIQYTAQAAGGALKLLESPISGVFKFFTGQKEILTEKRLPVSPLLSKDYFLSYRSKTFEQFKDTDIQAAAITIAAFPISSLRFGKPLIESASFVLGAKQVYSGVTEQRPQEVGGGLLLVSSAKPVAKAKRVFTEVVGESVPASEIYGGELSGRKVTSSSTAEALQQFEAGRLPSGKIEVVTVAPEFLKGETIVSSRKGKLGLEDPGGFFGPKGRANIMFTRLSETNSESLGYSFTDLFTSKQPTTSTFVATGITTYPKSVIAEPGFIGEKATTFRQSLTGTGQLVITKRSMLGKGEVIDTSISGKAGRGTIETEAIATEGATFKYVPGGLRERFRYTIINQAEVFGRKVPLTGDLIRLPKYEFVVTKEPITSNKLSELDINKIGESDVSSQISYARSKAVPSLSFKSSSVASKVSSSKAISSVSSVRSVLSRISPVSSNVSSVGSRISSNVGVSSEFSRTSSDTSIIIKPGIGSSSGRYVSPKISTTLISTPTRKPISDTPIITTKKTPLDINLRREDNKRFGVEVRRFGTFRSVGEGLSLKEAVKVGRFKVGTSAAATFRITKGGRPVEVDFRNRQFYSKGVEVIEKPSFRIKSGGELREITFKGIEAQRKNRFEGLI